MFLFIYGILVYLGKDSRYKICVLDLRGEEVKLEEELKLFNIIINMIYMCS